MSTLTYTMGMHYAQTLTLPAQDLVSCSHHLVSSELDQHYLHTASTVFSALRAENEKNN